MADSGILREVCTIEKTNKWQATHFALCNGNVIRYMIDLNNGKNRLRENISTYSGKLGMLMRLLNVLPLTVLQLGKMGYFARVKLENSVDEQRKSTQTEHWNIIVGTYNEKQKLVLQCFNKTGEASFIKIGNQATNVEMRNEIEYLVKERKYKSFDIPKIKGYGLIEDGDRFNTQITAEFHGQKVESVLTKEIVEIYKELAEDKKDGLEFSHGDFAPWNLKINNGRYTLFDWEHCGYREQGFDLMHYATVIQTHLNGKSLDEAIIGGLAEIRKFEQDFEIDTSSFKETFYRLRM